MISAQLDQPLTLAKPLAVHLASQNLREKKEID